MPGIIILNLNGRIDFMITLSAIIRNIYAFLHTSSTILKIGRRINFFVIDRRDAMQGVSSTIKYWCMAETSGMTFLSCKKINHV